MSRERMNDLLAALREVGWVLLGPEAYPEGSDDPFVLHGDGVKWGLASVSGSLLELEFHAFDGLGRRTDQLRDILYCVERSTGRKLYFEKRDNPEWKANLARFVEQVGKADDKGA